MIEVGAQTVSGSRHETHLSIPGQHLRTPRASGVHRIFSHAALPCPVSGISRRGTISLSIPTVDGIGMVQPSIY